MWLEDNEEFVKITFAGKLCLLAIMSLDMYILTIYLSDGKEIGDHRNLKIRNCSNNAAVKGLVHIYSKGWDSTLVIIFN